MKITLDYTHEIPNSTLEETVTLSYSAKKIFGIWWLTRSPGKRRLRGWTDLASFSSWSYRDAESRFAEFPEEETSNV